MHKRKQSQKTKEDNAKIKDAWEQFEKKQLNVEQFLEKMSKFEKGDSEYLGIFILYITPI